MRQRQEDGEFQASQEKVSERPYLKKQPKKKGEKEMVKSVNLNEDKS
jgi:hypothetical protein